MLDSLKILAFCVILTITGSCVSHKSGALEPTKISFNTLSCDCGYIKKGLEGICRFTFTNIGNHDLQISDVHSTWSCIQPAWPKELIKPGKEGKVDMVYKTDLLGTFSKSIYVVSNAKTVTLNIKGSVTE